MHIHPHDDHMHMHEHFHGDKDNIKVTAIGLVLHSIADGLALGASLFCNYLLFIFIIIIVSYETESSSSGLGMLIFFAVLLHKAPASIGFGTFLYHEGLRGFGVAKYVFVRNYSIINYIL